MAELEDLSFALRTFLRAYRWRRIDPLPWSPLTKPLTEARVALVSTAGMALPHQEPFDDHFRGGDPSYRVIPGDADPRHLLETHRSDSFDRAGLAADANLAFPLDRLREMADDDEIGEAAPRHLSLMGSQTAVGRLVKHTAPEAAELLAADRVDAALLVPI
jgi:D-proline reductase (dithiol) PrdB